MMHGLQVPLDNAQTERGLCMLNVQQKTSGCVRSFAGALMCCRIRGSLSSVCIFADRFAAGSGNRYLSTIILYRPQRYQSRLLCACQAFCLRDIHLLIWSIAL